MSKRKLEAFDPNKSDSEDLDWGAQSPPPRQRSQTKSRRSRKGSPRKKPKRTRHDTYGSDNSDIEVDSNATSDDEASFAESEDDQPVERNPRTGRSVRSVAKIPVKYEESEEEEQEIAATDSDTDLVQATPAPSRSRQTRRAALAKPSLIVKLKIPVSMEDERPTRARTSSRTAKRAPTPQAQVPAGARRSSRLSHDEVDPLVALTDSGRHETVTRAGSATPEPSTLRRPARGDKGLKKLPSAIYEVSHESSIGNAQPTTEEGETFFSQLGAAAADAEEGLSRASPISDNKEDDIRMEYADDGEEEEQVVQESQQDPVELEEADDDAGPVVRGGRKLRLRRKASTPPVPQPEGKSRRKLRSRKSGVEQSSDFEPDAEGDADADQEVSDSEDGLLKPSRGRNSSNDNSSQGRRSGRSSGKPASHRSRSRRNASPEDDELDAEEIADEAAELDEDNRRNRRSRKRPSKRSAEINFEPTLRNRGNRPDYRILRPELLLPIEDDDAPAVSTATPQRNKRGGGGGTYRSLFSTFGPFGGAGGPPPVFGGPEGTGALGGVDSDSSDDDGAARANQQNLGGAVGMTPTSAFPKSFSAQPQALNNDPVSGAGGGPAGLGKIKDRKALADADPLGVDPNVDFEGVGGLDNHINQLKEMVTLPLLYPEVFQRFHVTPPRGVLFHGPPGTGKTLLARALASSVSSHGRKVTFYMRKGADALSKWVGEAEKQLRLLFEEARKNQPSIIFFDEIDGLAPVRSSKQEQIHASIVATLLALMDGMDGRGQVIVIGATNRPDSVDPALRRPGRFDREFYFPLPDVVGRRKIIDIHTKGWDPPLQPDFKDELAEITRGYGGADLRALCTEAALNAVQGTYPQIYSSNQKLVIDPSTIKVQAKDFMISVNKIVPSSERSAASGATPLKKDIEPLLRRPLAEISERLDKLIPRKRKLTALEEAMYDDRDDDFGFQKETMQRDFESSRIFRPRLLIKGHEGMGQQYLGAALLSKFEGLHVQNFDLSNLLKDSTRSPEAAVVQMFEEVKRHKPSVIYIPNVNTWWDTLADTVKRTFVGLLRGLSPTEPVLVLGIMEATYPNKYVDDQMVHDLFGHSPNVQYDLKRPGEAERREYFGAVIEFMRKPPSAFPDPVQRKKRKLVELPVAPAPKAPEGPSKADIKAQKKKDRQTLNMLKLLIQPVMDQIRLKYKKFRFPPIDESTIAYLYDDKDPKVLTTDLTEEQRMQQQLFRPFEVAKDGKGVEGLREIATDKFYYNIEIVTIEKRLSNGYYKRPKDFLQDIKRLAKDAKTFGDQERLFKANEMVANVEVDMAALEQSQPALCAECEAVAQREQERERERLEKSREAQRRGEEIPVIIPNVPPVNASKTTTESSGPVMLGQEMPGRQLFPNKSNIDRGSMSKSWSSSNGSVPSHQTNGSHVPSPPREDVHMGDSFADDDDLGQNSADRQPSQQSGHILNTQQSQPAQQSMQQLSQRKSMSVLNSIDRASHPEHFENGGSTTNSAPRSSDHSSGPFSIDSQASLDVRPGDHPDFSAMIPGSGSDSQYPDTQSQSLESQPPQSFQQGVSSSRQSIHAVLNDNDDDDDDAAAAAAAAHPPYCCDEPLLQEVHEGMALKSSGLSLEQLEQVRTSMMDVIWTMRGQWNRDKVWWACKDTFNDTVKDIEKYQKVLKASQED